MANARHRVDDQRGTISGTYKTYGSFPSETLVSQTLVGRNDVCDDVVGNFRSANDFLSVKQTTFLPKFNGRYPLTGTKLKEHIGVPAGYKPAPPTPTSSYPPFTLVELSNLAWSALAATNINVPDIPVQTFIAELKDVPSLVRGWGQGLLKDVARGHLAWRWALKPMIRDLTSMYNFAEGVDERFRLLDRLTTGKGKTIKRKKSLRSSSSTSTSTVQLLSVGANIQGRRTLTVSERVWCSVSWKLADGVIPRVWNNREIQRMRGISRGLAAGINSAGALAALWEVTPWSWLVDWFAGIGTVMAATNNTIPLTWGTICIMRTTSAKALVEPLTSSADLAWCVPDGSHVQSEVRKERRTASPTLPFAPSYLPLISGKHWSILGSLAVLKR